MARTPKKRKVSSKKTRLARAAPQKIKIASTPQKTGLFNFLFMPSGSSTYMDKIKGAVVFVGLYLIVYFLITAVLVATNQISVTNATDGAQAGLLLSFSISVFLYF